MAHKVRGVVKVYNAQKGFGFIVCADGSGEVFVHHSEIKAEKFIKKGERSRLLKQGETVEFNVVIQADGQRKATNVTGPDGAPVIGDAMELDSHSPDGQG